MGQGRTQSGASLSETVHVKKEMYVISMCKYHLHMEGRCRKQEGTEIFWPIYYFVKLFW